MADNSKLITEFSEITSADSVTAEKFLELHCWNLQDALAGYYDVSNNPVPTERGELNTQVTEGNIQQEESQSQHDPLDTEEVIINGSDEHSNSNTTSPKRPRIKSVMSLRGLQSSDSDEERQAFYAGGSEFSGQQVLGPNRTNFNSGGSRDDELNYLLKLAQERTSAPAPDSRKGAKAVFSGIGYRLGQTDEDPVLVLDDEDDDEDEVQVTPATLEVVLKLWQDGFSVDDGPLREYSDPQNWTFLRTIMKGDTPEELRHEAHGAEVKVAIKDNRKDSYQKPKIRLKAFSGTGHLLGSPTPHVVSSPEYCSDEDSDIKVDDELPVTTIQVRLADGTCSKFRFNHNHKIKDLKKMIIRSHPQYRNRKFILVTSYPSKELCDSHLTLEEAGVLSSTILQRLK